MVFYYTGTGNSRYVARQISRGLSDSLFSINERIKTGENSAPNFENDLILVTPTYAWRIPKIVEKWLLSTAFPAGKRVWFIMTCGSEIGGASKYNRLLCQKKDWIYMGTAQIIMPENYIAMFSTPEVEEANAIINAAAPSIEAAINCLEKSCAFPEPKNRLFDRIMSAAVNPVFYKAFVKSKAFRVDSRCIHCGKCETLCPLNNIQLHDGKPVWGENCTHCMACICQCPAKAIEYGKMSKGKARYHID